jgi:hypothetical protein
MFDTNTDTFFARDLFTQGGFRERALTESDILGPSEAFRTPMDYYAHAHRHEPDIGLHGQRPHAARGADAQYDQVPVPIFSRITSAV